MRQGATPAKHEPGRPGGVREPFGGGAPQGPLEQRVGGGVGLAERDADLEAGRPDGTILKVCMARRSPTSRSTIPGEARRPPATSNLHGLAGRDGPADAHVP